MLPDVDVRLTVPEVRGTVKLPLVIEFCADSVIEEGAVIPAAKDRPPVVAVMLTFVAESVAPAAVDTAPADRRLKVAPAADGPVMLVDAPVFCRKTF